MTGPRRLDQADTSGARHRDGSRTQPSRTARLCGDSREHAVTVPGTGLVRKAGHELRQALEEGERPAPGVVRGVCELLLLAVEEAVRGAGVDDELVIDAGVGQGRLERVVQVLRDVLVVAGLERED